MANEDNKVERWEEEKLLPQHETRHDLELSQANTNADTVVIEVEELKCELIETKP